MAAERTFTGRKQSWTCFALDFLKGSRNKLITRMRKVGGNTSALRPVFLPPREEWSSTSQRREKQPF